MSENTAAAPKRWLKIALTVSLVINLVLIGFAVGFWLKEHRGMSGWHMSLHKMTADMAPESRENIHQIMKKHRPAIRAAMREMRQERRHMADLMAADTFDRAAADAAFERLKQLSVQVQDEMHQALIEAAAALPREDRQKLRLNDWKHKKDFKGADWPPKPPKPPKPDDGPPL